MIDLHVKHVFIMIPAAVLLLSIVVSLPCTVVMLWSGGNLSGASSLKIRKIKTRERYSGELEKTPYE